jgi:hypothetical protein
MHQFFSYRKGERATPAPCGTLRASANAAAHRIYRLMCLKALSRKHIPLADLRLRSSDVGGCGASDERANCAQRVFPHIDQISQVSVPELSDEFRYGEQEDSLKLPGKKVRLKVKSSPGKITGAMSTPTQSTDEASLRVRSGCARAAERPKLRVRE